MAVADGHGGSRYWLSDVGSRLACELAIAMASRDLASRPVAAADPSQMEAMRRWLADELPPRLLAAWQEAIQADWQQRQLPVEHEGERFSSHTYGSTLALVVLTPQWWGHSGIGDWDLVLLSNHQADRIISQESDNGLQGEATESLCLPDANRCFAARSGVYPLSGENRQACGLVLTTDGIRKSCATDADHLALSRYLLEEAQPHQQLAASETIHVDASLDRISREGSGDDVSVALASFGQLQAQVLHPPASASLLPELPPLPELPAEPCKRRHQQQIGLTVAVILMAASGIGSMAWFHTSPQQILPRPLALSAGQKKSLQQKIQILCNYPTLIEASLSGLKSQLKQMRTSPRSLLTVLESKHWLGTLVTSAIQRANTSVVSRSAGIWMRFGATNPTRSPIQNLDRRAAITHHN